MFHTPTDEAHLAKLLLLYNEEPGQREEVVAQIEREFQQTLAILALDTCSFSRLVRSEGIIHRLALLERFERLTVPILEEAGGSLLRREADNLFAVFPDVASAVAGAATIIRDVTIANVPLPAGDEIYVSIGIGYGSMLVVGHDNLFGDEMNIACKLGEDIAQQSEVLLTANAYAAIDTTVWKCEELDLSVSGIGLTVYRLMLKGQ